jgi:tetratricopeptide (TPR) repeat protein/TolB-like protein
VPIPKYNRRVLRRILICIGLVLVAVSAAQAENRTILVFPFENLSTDRSLDWIGEGIAELLIDRFQSEAGLVVFTRDERLAGYEKLGIPENTMVSRATALALGWDIGADRIVTGRFSVSAGELQVAARVIDMELSSSPEEIKEQGKLEDLMPVSNKLSLSLLRQVVPGTRAREIDYTSRPPIPRSAFENYIRGILNSDPSKRMELLRSAVRLYPGYGAAVFQLGHTLHLEREYRMSNQWLAQIADTSRNALQSQFLMGLNYFYLGDFPQAIATFQQLPLTFDVLLNLGAAFSRKGDYSSSITAWKRATENDALQSDAFFNLGYVNFLRNDYDGAIQNLTQSLKLHGRDSEALFLLGKAYERQGRIDESQKLISQAARLSQRVERWLTQPLPKLDRISAVADFQNPDDIWTPQRFARRAKSQDLTSWLEAIQNKIDSYRYGEAIKELQDLIRVYPNSSEANLLIEEVQRLRNSR